MDPKDTDKKARQAKVKEDKKLRGTAATTLDLCHYSMLWSNATGYYI